MKHAIYTVIILILITAWHCQPEKSFDTKWFVFSPERDFENSEIMMKDWLDAPAGKHGFVDMKDGSFTFEDETPVKFWGVNICSQEPYVENREADEWVEYLANFGVNAVRFHKFTSPALKGETSTVLDPEMLERMDYFFAKLKENGIYTGWSHIYGHRPGPADRDRLAAYDEIAGIKVPWSHLNSATSGLVNFARDLQDLNIELTVNMLNHLNPYTGKKYADDPALNFIELQNEDNIFWGAIEASLEQTPTYKNMLSRQFSEWLRKKYGSQEALEKAWGAGNLPGEETLEKMNIYPNPNHHVFSEEYNLALEENRPMKQDFLDKGRFLYEKQIEFYERFIQAIRETGYQGPIVGSCWQAGSGLLHLYNVLADYNTGFIDRHNYFGGGTGHRLDTGKVRNQAMVSAPGSGLLSTGLQMVIDRPFAFSEWMSLLPNQWIAEAAPIIAVYGMGLQGWDASYAFASNKTFYTRTVESENHGVYNVESPLHLPLYPALARMIYRNDITESDLLIIRNISPAGLAEGELGLVEQVSQDYDVKSFAGEVPHETLAIGKVAINFTDDPEETKVPEFKDYWNPVGKVISSSTGELTWNYKEQGYFTIDTDGTQGIVGFAGNINVVLENFEITMANPFGVIIMTSLDRYHSIIDASRILITTIARAENSGMEYNEDGTKLLSAGTPPVKMEGVVADIHIRGKTTPLIHVLDHIGRKTGRTIDPGRNNFRLDGAAYQTCYYLLEFE
ncbi:MAG: beta-galactosidase [Cyclobacteriaceae bacterium]|nr:beta-galactosidase [Cyclobacteriaceae bacterium]